MCGQKTIINHSPHAQTMYHDELSKGNKVRGAKKKGRKENTDIKWKNRKKIEKMGCIYYL